jgi:hypothetical protein
MTARKKKPVQQITSFGEYDGIHYGIVEFESSRNAGFQDYDLLLLHELATHGFVNFKQVYPKDGGKYGYLILTKNCTITKRQANAILTFELSDDEGDMGVEKKTTSTQRKSAKK